MPIIKQNFPNNENQLKKWHAPLKHKCKFAVNFKMRKMVITTTDIVLNKKHIYNTQFPEQFKSTLEEVCKS